MRNSLSAIGRGRCGCRFACAAPFLTPTGYKASYFGAAGSSTDFWLTRLPEFASPDWFDDSGAWAVRHETASAQLGPIVKGGVTYRPVSVAGSQWADGSWIKAPKDCRVWYQINYAPANDLDTTAPIAGLAVVEVMDSGKSAQEATPENQKFELVDAWLIEDAAGDPYRWDAVAKLANYHDDDGERVTCVGVDHFAYFERRINDSTAQHRVTYWEVGDVQPTVKTWANPEVEEDSTNWPCVNLSRHAFPMGQGKRTYIDRWPDNSLKRVRHKYRNGPILLSDMTLDTAEEVTFAPDSGPRIDCQRSQNAPSFTLAECRCYFRSWDLAGEWERAESPDPNDPNAEPIYPFNVPPFYSPDTEPSTEGVEYRWRDAFVISAAHDSRITSLASTLGFNLADGDPLSGVKIRILWGSATGVNEGLGVSAAEVTGRCPVRFRPNSWPLFSARRCESAQRPRPVLGDAFNRHRRHGPRSRRLGRRRRRLAADHQVFGAVGLASRNGQRKQVRGRERVRRDPHVDAPTGRQPGV
jgi:hypothetical protein